MAKKERDPIRLRRVPDAPRQFELAYPPCVRQRAEDLEEVRAMLDAGEIDVAVDELRWLLSGCRALLEAHKLLGEVALVDGDLPLARSHLGYAYELGQQALPADLTGTLPSDRPANQPFFEAGKALALCMRQQGEFYLAEAVLQRLLTLDPSDPLRLREMLAAK